MLRDCPYLKCLVRKEYLHDFELGLGEYEEAYAFAVTGIINRPLLFTVHLESGAVYSRLPIQALVTSACEDSYTLEQLMPYGVIGNRIEVVQHAYLKQYEVTTPLGDGVYQFTVDQFDGGFSEDPVQHKTMNVVALHSGHIGAWPNNMCRFLDGHFTVNMEVGYRRQSTVWRTG